MNVGRAAKAWTIFTVGLVAWLTDVIASKAGDITAREWKEALVVAIATVGVFIVPNASRSDA